MGSSDPRSSPDSGRTKPPTPPFRRMAVGSSFLFAELLAGRSGRITPDGAPRALGVRRIVAASPYHQLLPGARQPAFFLFNGGTDYTIPLWMGAKFVARARDGRAGVGAAPLPGRARGTMALRPLTTGCSGRSAAWPAAEPERDAAAPIAGGR
jgi:hypothetical protein